MRAYYFKHILNFKKPSGTSRGVLTNKETWFIIIGKNSKRGIGECGLLRTLSIDDKPDYEEKLQWVCKNIHLGKDVLYDNLIEYPSIQFGVEMAFLSLQSDNPYVLFPSEFTKSIDSIPINGLVWMGNYTDMKIQIQQKIQEGFSCIKLKIGAINFEEELSLLRDIRENYDENKIEIRVDANGAFNETNALDKINQLSGYKIHSIEQPVKKNNTDTMAELCNKTKIPIALDEELIGAFTIEEKETLLKKIMPQYIVLKPSLIGGFKGTLQWIDLANKYNIGWWVTSALESNVGLNAIAQFTYSLKTQMPQGLGTGSLYTNNIKCPLVIKNGHLHYDNTLEWESTLINTNF